MIQNQIYRIPEKVKDFAPLQLGDNDLLEYKRAMRTLCADVNRLKVQIDSLDKLLTMSDANDIMHTLTGSFNSITSLMAIFSEQLFLISQNIII